MSLWRVKLQEVVRALCVVALAFLSFGHAPLAAGGEFVATPLASTFCGDPIDNPAGAKANPCQACRIGAGAVLPPAPLPAAFIATTTFVRYLAPVSFGLPRTNRSHGRPRAPPAV